MRLFASLLRWGWDQRLAVLTVAVAAILWMQTVYVAWSASTSPAVWWDIRHWRNVSYAPSVQQTFQLRKNQPAWFSAIESARVVALLFHGAEVNLWHGMSQSAPRRLLHTWPLQVVQQEPLLNKLLTENVPNTLNCLQAMSFNQWHSSHTGHSAKQLFLSGWT